MVMDVNWYFALADAVKLAKRIKCLRAEIPIVVGGLTSTVFPGELLDEAPIDYILVGDAEGVFRELIVSLAEGRSVAGMPNLRWKDGGSDRTYTTTREDYNRLDYYTIDWFPRLQRLALFFQRRNRYPTFIYPFVPVMKGCISECVNCYGTPERQRLLFGRPRVVRSARAVRQDLQRLSADPDIQIVYMVNDFAGYQNKTYTEEVLSERYELDMLYEFCHVPSAETVSLFSRSFRRLYVALSTLNNHAERRIAREFERLPEVVEAFYSCGHRVTLYINSNLGRSIPAYRERSLRLWARRMGSDMFDSSVMNIPVPTPGLDRDSRRIEFKRYIMLSARPGVPLFFLRERLVRLCFLSARTTWLLRRMHTYQVAATLCLQILGKKLRRSEKIGP